MLVELVAGAALVLGVWARLAALAAVPVLIGDGAWALLPTPVKFGAARAAARSS